jgi:hypothetical protein
MVLVLNAGDGVFLGEALRKTHEGTVHGLVKNQREKDLLESHFSAVDYLFRPLISIAGVRSTGLPEIPEFDEGEVRFDLILGRNSLSKKESNTVYLEQIGLLLKKDGYLLLAESIPSEAQRLSAFMAESALGKRLFEKVKEIENKIYSFGKTDSQGWNETVLNSELKLSGFQIEDQQKTVFFNKTMITKTKLLEWFAKGSKGNKSYADYLAEELSKDEVEKIKQHLLNVLAGKVVRWKSSWLFVKANLKP